MVLLALRILTPELAALGDAGTPTEAQIAEAAAAILDGTHYSHRRPDESLSSQFLENYLDALDDSRVLFLQSDVNEFDWFRPTLARVTLAEGYTWAASLIYQRCLTRLAQKVGFQTNYLQTADFSFTGNDVWQVNRRDATRPADLKAARVLWEEATRADYLQEKLTGLAHAQIVAMLTLRYERRLEIMRQLATEDRLASYFDALANAYDPDSSYLTAKEYYELKGTMALTLGGIGGSLVLRDGQWVIGNLEPGGPAAHSGRLHAGDRILAVAQGDGGSEDVTECPSWHLIDLVRGPKGSMVTLTVLPAGKGAQEKRTVSLVRDNIDLVEGRPSAVIVDLPRGGHGAERLGIINLPLFYEKSESNGPSGTAADTARLIEKLKAENIRGLILDLRGNPGGALREAIGVTGLFIPAGPAFQSRTGAGHVEVERTGAANALYEGPMVVLTSRTSASAAEIVAGALQDYGRALIVGDSHTYGKGTVQTLMPLSELLDGSDCGAIKVTIGKLYRPGGDSTQLKGVVPDIVLPSETDRLDVGEVLSPNALAWDRVPPLLHTNFDWVGQVLPELRDKSAARVKGDKGFQLVSESLTAEIAHSERLVLNESRCRSEAARFAQISKEKNRAWRRCLAHGPHIRNLTLPDGDAVGLTPAGMVGRSAVDAAQDPDRCLESDFVLNETEKILADYIPMFPATSKPTPNPAPDRSPLAFSPAGHFINHH
jgi:carboxyl-terminal processing protease